MIPGYWERVVIGYIREDLGKGCADSLRQSGAAAEFVPLQITSEASWERAIPLAIDWTVPGSSPEPACPSTEAWACSNRRDREQRN